MSTIVFTLKTVALTAGIYLNRRLGTCGAIVFRGQMHEIWKLIIDMTYEVGCMYEACDPIRFRRYLDEQKIGGVLNHWIPGKEAWCIEKNPLSALCDPAMEGTTARRARLH